MSGSMAVFTMAGAARAAALALVLTAGVAPGIAGQEPDTITLARAAELALARHPSVVAAQAREDAAEAGAGIARAAWLPSLRTEASATRFQEPMIVAPLHGFEPGMVPAFDRTLIQGHVAAAWTLYEGGARGARIRQADALADAAAAQRAGAERALIAETARAYLRVGLAREVLEAHVAQRTALAEERSRAQQLFDEGRAARVVLLRVEAALARARADSAAAAVELDAARADLSRLTGVDAAPLPVTALSAPAGDAGWEALRAQALAASPEVEAARARAAAAEAAHAETRASYLPRVDLAARYHEYGSGAGDFDWEWQGGVLVSYPLFTGGARARQVERAAAEARAADADAATVAVRISEGVDRAFTAWRAAQARADALASAVAQQEEVVRIERLALVEGAGTQTDYLAAEAELLRTRAAWTEAVHTAIAARIDLARITGELTAAWLAENMGQDS